MQIRSVNPKIITTIAGLLCILFLHGRVDTLFSENGTIQEIGIMQDGFKDGPWTSYFPDGNIRSEGEFNKGFRIGEWTWYHENGTICAIEKWRRGVFRKGDYWDRNGNPSDINEVLTHPEYPGGIEAFTKMIVENIIYPEEALEAEIEGRVVLEFQISPAGRLINPSIAERAHPDLNREALRVVQLSDSWIPAKFHGQSTSAQYTFPISFALQ